MNIEYKYNCFSDLVFYLMAHMKVDNASDNYDEDFIFKMKDIFGEMPYISDSITKYYNNNFERLAQINFVPVLANNKNELLSFINTISVTEEDNIYFFSPFNDLISEWTKEYSSYWNIYNDSLQSDKQIVENYTNLLVEKFSSFFDFVLKRMNRQLCIVFSHSLRKAGRAFCHNENFYVVLPFPKKENIENVFFQLVHECTHTLTDQLLNDIRMDDGTHDIAEYQVCLFDLWLIEFIDNNYAEKYQKWISEEFLEECLNNLSEKKLEALKRIFSGVFQ